MEEKEREEETFGRIVVRGQETRAQQSGEETRTQRSGQEANRTTGWRS